jgi:hypothetical protein
VHSKEVQIPEGYQFATVLLQGWRFNFAKERQDHAIKTIGLNIENKRFNLHSNTLSWDVQVEYNDKQFDRDDDSFYFQC